MTSRSLVIAFLSLLFAAPAAHAQSSGLVAAYGFEEPSGTAVVDSSGTGNAGTVAGATRSASGRFGAALSFDGTNDRVDVADSASLDLATGMTLQAWVRPQSANWRTVLMKERPGGLAYLLYASTDTNRPSTEVQTSSTSEARGTTTLPTNVWTHLASTYDGATLRLYVNGTQVATRAAAGAITATSNPLRIGGNTVWGEYFGGLIDEVRVYNRALTAGEIQLDMGRAIISPDAEPPSAPTGLAATVTGDDVHLSWGAASDNVGVTGYRVYRDGSLVTTLGATAATYDDLDRAPGTYRYTVVAVDGAGLAGPASNEATIVVPEPDGDPPTAPELTATVTSDDVSLSWTEATDDVGVKEYRLYRDGTLITTRTTREYSDGDRPTGTYRYKVVAVDNSGHTSPDSNEAEAVVEPDTTPPTGSVGICEGATVQDYVTLRPSWSDDRGPVTYELFLDGESVRAPETGGPTGAFYWDFETREISDGPHLMALVLRDGAGNVTTVPCEWNVHNPEVTIPITSHQDGDTISGNVKFTADVLGDGQPLNRDMLRVSWSLTPVGGGPGSNGTDTTRPFEFTFGTGMAPDGLYDLKVSATWLDYSGPLATNTIQVRIHNAPPAPTGVRTEVRGNAVDVMWDPIPGVYSYNVYRDGTKIGNTSFNGYTDGNRPPGTYRYVVKAQQYQAESPPSAEVTATVAGDATPPVVTLASNCNGATVHDYITLQPTVSDDRGPVTLTIKVDGQIIRGPDPMFQMGSYLFDWETQGLSNGVHVMQAIARDGAGNESIATCNWNVHNPAVTLPFTSHSTGDTVRGTVLIKTQPLGDGQPLAREAMVVRLNATGPASATDPGYFDKEWSWDTTTVPDGLYTIHAAVTWMGYHQDFATNSIQLRVDNVDTEPPTAPELTATVADGDDDVELSWTESSDARGVTSYRLHRDGVLIRTLAASVRSFRDVDVPVGTRRYTVRAVDAAGNTSPASDEEAVTIAPDTQPPTAPEVTATVEADGVHLSWTASQDRGPVTYEVYRLGAIFGDRSTRLTGVDSSTRQHVDRTNLPTNTTYAYRVAVTDGAGNRTNSVWIHARIGAPDLEAPTAPVLTVTNGDLFWTAATDDHAIMEYAVYVDGLAVQFYSRNILSDEFLSLTPGTHQLQVKATDSAFKVSESNIVEVTVAAPPTTHAPSIIASTLAPDNNDIRVMWGEAIGNAPISEYRLYRDGSLIQTRGASASRTYWDVNMAPGTYRYQVVAVDTAGGTLTSGVSPETIAPDTSAPAATLSTACGTVQGTVDVRGTITDDRGPFAWRLELDGQTIAGPFDVTEPTASIQRAWDTTAAADGSHELTLVVRDAGGNETESAPCTVNVRNVVLPSGLVAAYGFEHTSGTTATDSSGKGNAGTIAGATSVADGKSGRALSFDGINDLVTAADSNSLDLQPGMTLSAWVKPATVSDWRTVLLKERPGQLAYALYASTDNGRPMTEITVSGQRDARGTAALPVGVWSHLAATYDGANVRLYVNGAQVASTPAAGTLFNSAGALRIGGNTVWGEYFSGLIDEVRVYERALSAAEIQAGT